MKNDLLDNYTRLNNSFQDKLVFHLGADAGFFSEYNNMILAMLYCLKHKIRFSIYSGSALFRYDKGWTDYFLPFCEDETNTKIPFFSHAAPHFHEKYNTRDYQEGKLNYTRTDKIKIWWYKQWNHVTYLTQDIWRNLRDGKLESEHYDIPELNINGDLLDATRQLIKLTWRYNDTVQLEIDNIINSLQLPDEYLGIHVRRGDKHMENKLMNIETYVDKINMLAPDIKNLFVLTDNYEVIRDIQKIYPSFKIYTLCGKDETGYIHSDFQKQSRRSIRDAHLKLFASMDVLSKSVYFVGTFSSNPGMYLGMKMKKGTAFGVDYDKWLIW